MRVSASLLVLTPASQPAAYLLYTCIHVLFLIYEIQIALVYSPVVKRPQSSVQAIHALVSPLR